MAHTLSGYLHWGHRQDVVTPADRAALAECPAYQAYQILHVAFVIAPVLAGLDKFAHLLVNWDLYLAPWVNRLLGGHGHEFMLIVGIVEIIAGIGVLLLPRIFGYVVMAWLWCIIINLLMVPGYYDIALRDFGLSLGALALARLAAEFGGPLGHVLGPNTTTGA